MVDDGGHHVVSRKSYGVDSRNQAWLVIDISLNVTDGRGINDDVHYWFSYDLSVALLVSYVKLK